MALTFTSVSDRYRILSALRGCLDGQCTGAGDIHTDGSMTNDALSSSFVQLMGISLGTPWEIPNWRTTDVEGTLTENGSLRADTVGDHTLWALVAGKASNNVVLKIVSCPK
jgi:hypothetical protein